MLGMRVNIFSLQRIRRKGACSYTFKGEPQPRKVIPIYNREGQQIATMRETLRARSTLVCDKLNGVEKMEGEVLGGKEISMELLHKRLGHTSQGGMERLVREQMVRGLEEGIKGNFGMCRKCTMGRLSEKSHPRKDPKFGAKEPLELIHTDIASPFNPKAMEGGGQCNLCSMLILRNEQRAIRCVDYSKDIDTRIVHGE